MSSYNRVIIAGNLTRDVELRRIGSGTAVTDVGLAVNDRVKKGDQWVDETTFVDVTIWGRTAEVCNEYCSKGSSVLIEGRLKLDTWEKDGQKRSKLRVVADKMQLLGGKPEPSANARRNEPPSKPQPPPSNRTTQQQMEYSGATGPPPDDIPF